MMRKLSRAIGAVGGGDDFAVGGRGRPRKAGADFVPRPVAMRMGRKGEDHIFPHQGRQVGRLLVFQIDVGGELRGLQGIGEFLQAAHALQFHVQRGGAGGPDGVLVGADIESVGDGADGADGIGGRQVEEVFAGLLALDVEALRRNLADMDADHGGGGLGGGATDENAVIQSEATTNCQGALWHGGTFWRAVRFPAGARDGLPAGARFRVQAGEQPAGRDRGLALEEGTALRVFTGAPLPRGTDAVVMQEDADARDSALTVRETVAAGEFIRRAGADLCRGQRLLAAGETVTPQAVAALAAQGLATILAPRRPRVAILATGDELQPPGAPLLLGCLYESNGPMLAALCAVAGAQALPLGVAPDDLGATRGLIARGLTEADALVVAGGMSVGERDFVKEALAAEGVRADLWRVAMKPGKPFLFGRGREGQAVFGLPGNPVSAFVTFLIFALPALRRMGGAPVADAPLPMVPAVAGEPLANRDSRPHWLRGRLDRGTFHPTGRQESHALGGLLRANALVRVPAGASFAAGAAMEALLW